MNEWYFRSSIVQNGMTVLYALVQSLLILESPWKSISSKFFNDLPCSNGFDVVDIVIDLFTKMPQFLPCTTVISS